MSSLYQQSKPWLPSLITLCNLILGVIALIAINRHDVVVAAWLILVGMIADGLDGKLARLLHAESAFGKQLDSLADLVTFGLAPAFLLLHTLPLAWGSYRILFAIFFVLCGAFRLARFTVQAPSSIYFTGIPITAAGSLVATYVLSSSYIPSWGLPLMSLVLSGLMVSSFPYPKVNRIVMAKRWSMITIGLTGFVFVGLVALFLLYLRLVPLVLMVLLLGYAAYGVLRAVFSPLWRHFHKNHVEFDLHPVKR